MEGCTHGEIPDWHISPVAAFPFTTPLTDHVTDAFELFATSAVNVAVWLNDSRAEGGEIVTVILLVRVTLAETVAKIAAFGSALAYAMA
jgi:hypothetical protein